MDTPKPMIFVFASCQYPAGLLDKALASKSYLRLAARTLLANAPIAPLFLLGDQIYADATAGLADPKSWKDRYQNRYADSNAQAAVAQNNRTVYTMLDDHEIDEGWEPYCRLEWQSYLQKALEAYSATDPTPSSVSPRAGNQLWYTLTESGFPFFVADTRTQREHRTVLTTMQARIMSETQMDALKAWLKACDRDKPKFIAMPAMPLPRRLATAGNPCDAWRSDAWDGYPASLHDLLGFIADQQIEHVVFLSGDEHLANRCQITLTPCAKGKKPIHVLSLHAPALYAPFPFANGKAQDYKADDSFSFTYTRAHNASKIDIDCAVTTEFPNVGDGFVMVTLTAQPAGKWAIEVEVNGCNGAIVWPALTTPN